jgi:hypothetical protein
VVGDPSAPPPIIRFDGTQQATWRTAATDTAPLADITIRHLRFENVGLVFQGATTRDSANIHIAGVEFADGLMAKAGANDWMTHYLSFQFIRNPTVERCVFERADFSHGGRGIYFHSVVNGLIADSFIGTTRDLDRSLGYFKTGVNVTSYALDLQSEHVVAVRNTIHRTDNPCSSSVPGDETDPCQDHAWYSWGARDVEFLDNRVSGWESNESGLVKMRNSREMFVERNHLRDSGLMFHLYPADTKPEVFERSVVRDNRIDLGGVASTRGAIEYSRDNASGGWSSGDPGFEAENNFVGNSLPGGGVIRLSHGRADGFCLTGNGGTTSLVDMTGTYSVSGCVADPAWDRPLRGAYRGDFDGDGTSDLIHIGAGQGGQDAWIVHRSDAAGQHAIVEEWPAPDGLGPATASYGGHVGDFDGDQLADDLVYLGLCDGGASCWRVLIGTGDGFAPAASWSTTLWTSADSALFGVHVGDFDGDGRDDLAYRGSCAGADCWVVQRSNGHAFVTESWSDGFYPSAETRTYGVVVGDFDGDGKDDLLYRGYAGATVPTWRVQISHGTSFGAAGWGDSSAFTWESAHFGLEVADIDGDGRSDLGYMATCGNGSPRRWRNLISTGSGFTVSCSTSNRFPAAR